MALMPKMLPYYAGNLEGLPVVTRFFCPPETPRTMLFPTMVSWQTCTTINSTKSDD